MARRSKEAVNPACCDAPGLDIDRCKVEALVSVDERGQMVLPKDLRDRAGIAPGDKLAVIAREKDGKVCCFYLFKADDLISAVSDMLGPLAGEIKK